MWMIINKIKSKIDLVIIHLAQKFLSSFNLNLKFLLLA